MSDNLHEFELGLKQFAKKNVPDAVGDFRDAVALEALKGVVVLTPKDTGRAAGNWQTTVGQPAEGDVDRTDKGGSGEPGVPVVDTFGVGASEIATARGRPFEPIWLHNGLDYAEHINNGTERVPAVHMVEQTVQRIKRRFGGV